MLEAVDGFGPRPRLQRFRAPRVVTAASLPAHTMLVVVTLLFAVSGGMLWLIGLNYDGLQGGAASKLHPSTYLIVALFGCMALRAGNPVAYIGQFATRRPASLFLLFATVAMFISIAARGAPGLAGSLDTYLGASLIVMLLADFDERAMARIELLVHALMSINALMGLGEFLSGHLFFPYRFDGEVFPMDHRSSALQGHPLTNASVTATYVVSLMCGGRLSVSPTWRLPLIGLQLAALVAFGGRTGLVVALVFGAFTGLLRLHAVLRRGRVPVFGAAAAALLLTIVPVVIGGMAAGGFFNDILDRFASDGGSAYARVQMFELFDRLPLRELVVGPDAAYVDSIRRITGLEWGIENPIIKTLLYQGLVVTALISVAVVAYIWEISRVTGPGTLMPIVAFAILINTSESIGGKTTMLTKFAVLLLALHRLPAVQTVSARWRTEAQRR